MHRKIFLVVSVFLWQLVSVTNSQQWWCFSRLPVLPSQHNKPSSFSHPWARQSGQAGYMHASPPALTLDTYYLVLASAFDTGLVVEGQPAPQTPSMSIHSDAPKKSNSRSVRRDCDSKYSRRIYGGKYRSQCPVLLLLQLAVCYTNQVQAKLYMSCMLHSLYVWFKLLTHKLTEQLSFRKMELFKLYKNANKKMTGYDQLSTASSR